VATFSLNSWNTASRRCAGEAGIARLLGRPPFRKGPATAENVSRFRTQPTTFRTAVPAPEVGFKITGEPTIYVKTTADSGNPRAQAFCPRCGSPIYASAVGDGPKVYLIRVGTARQRAQLAPKRQIWCRSEQGWLGEIATVRKLEKQV